MVTLRIYLIITLSVIIKNHSKNTQRRAAIFVTPDATVTMTLTAKHLAAMKYYFDSGKYITNEFILGIRCIKVRTREPEV